MTSSMEKKPSRHLPHRPFPPYAFIPGQAPHPEKEGGHLYGKEIKIDLGPKGNFLECEDFYYGIDLFNGSFPWEAHVYWEALWNALGRTSPDARFLKALIKLAAFKVQLLMKNREIAQKHLERSLEILVQLQGENYSGPQSLPLAALISKLKDNIDNFMGDNDDFFNGFFL